MFGKKPLSTELPVEPLAIVASTTSASLPQNVTISPPAESKPKAPAQPARIVSAETPIAIFTDQKLVTPDFLQSKKILINQMLEQVNFTALEKMTKEMRRVRVSEFVDTLLATLQAPLTSAQSTLLKADLLNEVLGFGPIEVLMADPEVSDIMINTHRQVYIEKLGKIYLSDISFTSDRHLLDLIQKIVTLVGRRVDETSPMVDARMPDGSRFNAIIPPLAIDGCLVSIRKFKKNKMPLSQYAEIGSMSHNMAKFLEICAAIRLNVIISGGTGSGKTTLLNALSGHIDLGERVITIEDAAELLLHQPHVLRLETRPPNMEGVGEINQRQLVRNALRMRPDRIILGEIRGDEAVDLLSAMNTGHDGSMATIHSNNPRDCLSRLENLLAMSGVQIPISALRQQIASAVNLIVQVARLRDGMRRVTHIDEIMGMERDTIVTQPIFAFQPGPMDAKGMLTGKYVSNRIRPRFLTQAQYYNRDKEMIETLELEKIR